MTPEQRHVPFGRSVIDYRIERSVRRRTVTIAVDSGAGVVLKAPTGASMHRLDHVVKTKAPWILQRLMEFREFGPGPTPKEFVAGESYSYLGRNYRLKIEKSSDSVKPFASLHGAFLAVALPRRVPPRDALVRLAVVSWYRKQAHRRLPERVALYAGRAGLHQPPVLVRAQEKRWGAAIARGSSASTGA
ncbi:MAG: DUF45 domain-containing protein [Myxococcales bacterium]|nr:DUF45 domain-containing protein [Myxococcales bacterium]